MPWTNVYERAVTADDDVRMEFIEPDPDALADIHEKGASVDADRICEFGNRQVHVERGQGGVI